VFADASPRGLVLMQTTQTSLPPPDAFVPALCIELFPFRALVLKTGKKCAAGCRRPAMRWHGRAMSARSQGNGEAMAEQGRWPQLAARANGNRG